MVKLSLIVDKFIKGGNKYKSPIKSSLGHKILFPGIKLRNKSPDSLSKLPVVSWNTRKIPIYNRNNIQT